MSDGGEDKVERIQHLQAQGVNGRAACEIVRLQDECAECKTELSNLRVQLECLALDISRLQEGKFVIKLTPLEEVLDA